MDASIKESVKASDKEAQYDEKAKKLLGHKIILAYILVNTVEEFQGMNPKDVVKYIEGEPYISTVPLDPGMTNTKERKEGSIKETETPEQIRGLNTENSELNEGMMRFDIIFYVRMKDGLTQIMVNIEAQKEELGKYYILNRAIFYIGRIVSSQKGRDFVKSEYNKMKRVYSIWICMNAPQYIGNAISEYKLEKTDLIPGIPDRRKEYDKLSVVMVCLNTKKETEDQFLGMLQTLFNTELAEKEKKERLEQEYEIQMENGFGKELSLMCNLSDTVEERGIQKGIEKGIEQGMEKGIEKGKLEMLFSLVRDHVLSSADAAKRVGMSEAEFVSLMQK